MLVFEVGWHVIGVMCVFQYVRMVELVLGLVVVKRFLDVVGVVVVVVDGLVVSDIMAKWFVDVLVVVGIVCRVVCPVCRRVNRGFWLRW